VLASGTEAGSPSRHRPRAEVGARPGLFPNRRPSGVSWAASASTSCRLLRRRT